MTENLLNEPADETAAELVSLALQVIPVVGPIMSSTAMFFLDREKNARLNRFLIQLSQDMKILNDKINLDFIRKDEFRDLVENIFSKATQTRQQEKLDSFRTIFTNTITSSDVSYSTIEEITDLVQSWQTLHIRLIKILNDPHKFAETTQPAITTDGNQWTLSGFFSRFLPEYNNELLRRIWTRLFVDGVINMDYQPNKSIFFTRGIKTGYLTKFGEEIVRLLIDQAKTEL